jgi:cellobiose phosphorylase
VATYKAEPYVVAADVYGVAPHIGRGGWSWYTGSAGWMYRLLLESLLGLRLEVVQGAAWLHLQPCLPDAWPGYSLDYRHRGTLYRIEVQCTDASGDAGLFVDGVQQDGPALRLADDQQHHEVVLRLARNPVRPNAQLAPAQA